VAAQLNEPPALDAEPPKPVQRWAASDYAKNGRFVQELAGAIFHMLAAKPGERILDLGCGDGALTAEIRALGADVLGVDLSEELLAVARMKGLAVRKLDGHALDFVSEFDAVFSNAALHWMRKPKLVIAGVARALRPRGRFVGELAGMAMSRRSERRSVPSAPAAAPIPRSPRPGSFRRPRNMGACLPKAASP
jgi:SAM-dependent methyltransferase